MARAESGSIQQLGKDRWRVRVSGGNDPVTGKRIRLTRTVHGTKKDAIAERTRMQIEVGDMDRATKDVTVAQFLQDIYLPYQEQNVRKTSYKAEEWRIRKYVLPGIGHVKMSKLSPYVVETWLGTIESSFTRYDAYRIMRYSFKLACKWGIVTRNVLDKVDPPAVEYNEKVVADAELASMIIAAMYGEPIEPIFLLEIGCGLRLSEALALDWEDIDYQRGKVSIHRTYQYVPHEGCQFFDVKTKKSKRTVNIPKSILERIKELRMEGGIMRFGPLCHGLKEDNANERITPQGYRHKYSRVYAEKLPGEQYITLRNLRHTHATILLTEKVDIKTIADRLGHSNVKTTMNFYLQHVEKLDDEASNVFDDAIRFAKPRKEPENIVQLPPAKEA